MMWKRWVFLGLCLFCTVHCDADNILFYYKMKALSREIDASRPAKDPNGVLISKDPTIGFLPLTEELLKEPELSAWAKFDPGFEKWIVVFREIPGEPPYSIRLKRIAQHDPERFCPTEALMPKQIAALKKLVGVACVVVSARGFLPGEEITFRLATKDPKIYREISLCPRPLVLKKTTGDLLLKAALQKNPHELTAYHLEISGINENERFQFLSKSGSETMQNEVRGPAFINYTPGVEGLNGGVANLELSFEDGSTYKLDFPWGAELYPYLIGNK